MPTFFYKAKKKAQISKNLVLVYNNFLLECPTTAAFGLFFANHQFEETAGANDVMFRF